MQLALGQPVGAAVPDHLALLRHDVGRLDQWPVFQTRSVADARARIGSALTSHRLDVCAGHKVDTAFRQATIGPLSVLLLRYGADVMIDPDPLEQYVLLQIVLSGSAEIRQRRGATELRAGDGVIIEALGQSQLFWSAECEQMIVPLHRSVLNAAAETIFGDAPVSSFGFNPVFNLADEQGAAIGGLMRYLMTQINPGAHENGPSIGQPLQTLLAHHLIHHHTVRRSTRPRAAHAAPRYVRRAEDFMTEHLEIEFTLADLARHAQISARTLCAGFRRFRGTTPFAALRALRLDQARKAIKLGLCGSVTDVALRFHFNHVGRFAAAYARRFGELPSETFRKETCAVQVEA